MADQEVKAGLRLRLGTIIFVVSFCSPILASFFVLGGGFWGEIRALFIHRESVVAEMRNLSRQTNLHSSQAGLILLLYQSKLTGIQ
jgi:hypothetical protein